jgi:hypothetical protein
MKGIDPASHIRARHVRQVEDEVLQCTEYYYTFSAY